MDNQAITPGLDLISERIGGQVLYANDEFFAEKENLLKPGRGIFIPDKYTDRGKWMDGWESRRRRTPGHDWCLIKLGVPGVINGLDVDTNHFLGNYPEHCSLEACWLPGNPSVGELNNPATRWYEILPRKRLEGGSQNLFDIPSPEPWTHLRFHIYPDGGVARLRAYGAVAPAWPALQQTGEPIDLASVRNGARAVLCSDMFFSAMDNLLMPGRGFNMGDGWETKRKRVPGHDWIVVQLGAPGRIQRLEVDTCHFKGNFPESCSIEGCYAEDVPPDFLASRSLEWETVLPRTKLEADTQHFYVQEITSQSDFTHLRLSIYPDGGISRLRAWGELSPYARFNLQSPEQARRDLTRCCGASRWVDAMLAAYPFKTRGQVFEQAERAADQQLREDWLEAFAHHPPIGDLEALRGHFAATAAWAAAEQAGSQGAPDEVLQALAEGNRVYAEKFGHIFIVCASGKSAHEMLEILQARLPNDPATELTIAAYEQRKITRLRLEKLLL